MGMQRKSTIWRIVMALLVVAGMASTLRAQDPTRIPSLDDDVQFKNEFCTYQNKVPFVKKVNWQHPLIQKSKKAFAKVSKGMMTYGEWRTPYGLEGDWTFYKKEYKTATEERKKEIDEMLVEINFRNFVKVLCGEYRDYPAMIRKKLEVCAERMPVVPKGEPKQPAADRPDVWGQMTGEAYEKMRYLMDEVYDARLKKKNPGFSSWSPSYNYGFGENGHSSHRVENSVPPFTHAEMRYIFWKYLHKKSVGFELEDYEKGLKEFIAKHCDPNPNGPDLGWMYNFRGHKNFKPLWLESNAFIWNSRHAGAVLKAQFNLREWADFSYYKRPFATRYTRAKGAWGAFIFFKDEHEEHFIKASERGGGPQLYIGYGDSNGDGVSDYRLFKNVMGKGDIGLGSQALDVERMDDVQPTQGLTAGFDPVAFKNSPDWGFMKAFPTFEERMIRINAGLDRHTNWGPTHFYSALAREKAEAMIARADELEKEADDLEAAGKTKKADRKRGTADWLRGSGDWMKRGTAIMPTYSPIVACSYMIDASHSFAVGNYPSTHPDEKNKVKWMFVMKFQTKHYYDEKDLKAGEPINWKTDYFNETSLSNDFYTERALDRFGWIPIDNIDANLYLVEAEGEGHYYDPGPSADEDEEKADETDPAGGSSEGIVPTLEDSDEEGDADAGGTSGAGKKGSKDSEGKKKAASPSGSEKE